MKTKELKKIVEDNGFGFSIQEDGDVVVLRNDNVVMKVICVKNVVLSQGWFLRTKYIKNVMKALIEYSETPIEEREEEKKYYFTFNEYFLIYNHVYKTYELAVTIKRIFTQSEIDNFPPEIKGAIECGFLKKVEVEE